ncbi:MAG: hypothetical protein QW806_09960 [Nitrososphaerota archaeon]
MILDNYRVTIDDIINRNYTIGISEPICIDNYLWINISSNKVYRYINSNWVEVDTIQNFYKLYNIIENAVYNARLFKSCSR